jgi:hypothetical protein
MNPFTPLAKGAAVVGFLAGHAQHLFTVALFNITGIGSVELRLNCCLRLLETESVVEGREQNKLVRYSLLSPETVLKGESGSPLL